MTLKQILGLDSHPKPFLLLEFKQPYISWFHQHLVISSVFHTTQLWHNFPISEFFECSIQSDDNRIKSGGHNSIRLLKKTWITYLL